MKKFLLQNLWWVTFVLAIALLGLHSFKLADVKVDSTSILLLILILISPFIASVRKIKYGDFEAEIDPKEIEKIKSEAEKNSISEPKDTNEKSEIYITTDAIKELAKSDPVIALAKLRIELEKVMVRLAKNSGIDTGRSALGSTIRSLTNHEIISKNIGKSLLEVVSICNRAIHGEAISEESANTIIQLGISILEDAYFHAQSLVTLGTVLNEEIITSEESEEYYQGKRYHLTSIIPLVDEPKKITRELNQEQLDNFLEGYHEYAEYIIELKEIKNG